MAHPDAQLFLDLATAFCAHSKGFNLTVRSAHIKDVSGLPQEVVTEGMKTDWLVLDYLTSNDRDMRMNMTLDGVDAVLCFGTRLCRVFVPWNAVSILGGRWAGYGIEIKAEKPTAEQPPEPEVKTPPPPGKVVPFRRRRH